VADWVFRSVAVSRYAERNDPNHGAGDAALKKVLWQYVRDQDVEHENTVRYVAAFVDAAQSKAKMRNLIYAINVTLDGCCEHTKGPGRGPIEEIIEYHTQLMRDVDLLVYGRKTYQLMVPFWPDVAKNQSHTKVGNEFARTFDSIPKLVFSQSIASTEEKNTRLVRTSLQDEILKLKKEQGKNILTGGVSIPSQLIKLGLVDEFHVVILPIIAGEGRRLMEGVSLHETLQLKLVESKILKSGCVALRYVKQ
jgi:dihydrofolate reductase